MTAYYSDRLLCGNCIQTRTLVPPQGNLRMCKTNKCIIDITENLCDGFTWSGETDPDGQLLRFPREVQSPIPLNA